MVYSSANYVCQGNWAKGSTIHAFLVSTIEKTRKHNLGSVNIAIKIISALTILPLLHEEASPKIDYNIDNTILYTHK